MSSFLASHDGQLLLVIAEYRILTPDQLAVQCDRNAAATRRRLAILRDMGLVEIRARSLHVGRGHPESLVSLSENGAECLKALGLIDADAPTDQLTAGSLKCIRHEEVVNEVRVQLTLMNRHLDGLSAVYHASTPPVQPRAGHGVACPGNGSPQDACGQDHELIPDGVFALTHTKIGKTLLFFLEVDMGTQPLISNRAQNRDVRSKLTRYQALLGDGGYRR